MLNPENLNGVASDGLTALTRAASRGSIEDVKFLIDAGDDVNTSDAKGTPVFHAASNGHLECLRFLVEAGQQGCQRQHSHCASCKRGTSEVFESADKSRSRFECLWSQIQFHTFD